MNTLLSSSIRSALFLMLSALASGALFGMPADDRPITTATPDLTRLKKWNDSNGDTADPFWADDGKLYLFMCDGRGFGKSNRNLGFNRLDGDDLATLTGALVNPMDYGKADELRKDGATWKICGQECIDGVFYGFVVRNVYGKWSKDPLTRQTSFNASLIASTDRGLTWRRSQDENYDHPMWPGRRFGAPCFVHYGRNGGRVTKDRADEYIYALSNNGFWDEGDDLIIGRVKRSAIARLDAQDWSYFTGGDGEKDPAWSADLTQAKPVLAREAKLSWGAPTFVPALNRYVLTTWHCNPHLKSWFTPQQIVYQTYEAPHPWGPWTFVSEFSDEFLNGGHMYGPNLCAKYQEQRNGSVSVWLFTSGCPFQDAPGGLYKMWCYPLVLTTGPVPTTTTINDSDPQVRYTGAWRPLPTNKRHSLGDDLHQSNTVGDVAELTFTGTGIAVLGERDSDLGRFDVTIDGEPQGEVDLKQAKDYPRLVRIAVFRSRHLAPGPHTIRLTNRSTTTIFIDGFEVSRDP